MITKTAKHSDKFKGREFFSLPFSFQKFSKFRPTPQSMLN